MIKTKIIFAWMLSSGIIQPMNEKNNDRDMYTLYVIDSKTEQVYAYEHAYKEEIIEYIETGDIEYETTAKAEKEK